ncbi:hypothetical protein EXD91_11740 [Acinetobacter pittii]|uniref:hypothetical protein n=2 Tax=Acinetobacter pittii TaxID=48296 RepID=UPI0010234AC5|nr:hypothetical protein [Acinetobacter pittii]RZH48397.1 hypothetical protein EXD91_11740 [Acinetobacter pittii]
MVYVALQVLLCQGTNFWRLLSIILGFIIFLGLYYFFIVYPKDTEQARIRFSEEVMASFFWMDLSDEVEINSIILKEGLELNPINDEIYINDLNGLSSFYVWNGEHKEMKDVLNKYSEYSYFGNKGIRGLCLKLMFVQQYNQKIQQKNYSSSRLLASKKINKRNLETISPWLNDMKAFDEFYKAKHMIPNCKI